MKRIYPDTLDHFESQSGQSEDHWQIYSITDGMGGSGVGDISGRLVQELLIQHVAELTNTDPQTFNFADFSSKFLRSAQKRLDERLARYKLREVGCSLAFLLISGSTAYTFSIGTNRIYLIRNNKIFKLTQDHQIEEKGIIKPALYLGNTPGKEKSEPQNLNKLILEKNDIILLSSDGLHNLYTEEELLETSQNNSSFVSSINQFNDKVSGKNIADDYTLLGLKVKNAKAMVIDIINSSKQPTEQIDLIDCEIDCDSSKTSDKDDAISNFNQIEKKEQKHSKFKKSFKLFLLSFGLGLLIGILLLFLYWILYIGF